MRLTLIENSATLPLSAEAEIQITLSNPFFSTDESEILPFSLPRTSETDSVFGDAGIFPTGETPQLEYQCLLQSGVFQRFGTLKLLSVSRDGYNMSITLNTSSYWNKVGDKTLKEIFSYSDGQKMALGVTGLKDYELNTLDWVDKHDSICSPDGTTAPINGDWTTKFANSYDEFYAFEEDTTGILVARAYWAKLLTNLMIGGSPTFDLTKSWQSGREEGEVVKGRQNSGAKAFKEDPRVCQTQSAIKDEQETLQAKLPFVVFPVVFVDEILDDEKDKKYKQAQCGLNIPNPAPVSDRQQNKNLQVSYWGQSVLNKIASKLHVQYSGAGIYDKDGEEYTEFLEPFPDGLRSAVYADQMMGYNMSCFLKVQFILDKIFEQAGFRLEMNFGTEKAYSTTNTTKHFTLAELRENWWRLCVINNTRDALMPGMIYLDTLVPEKTTVKNFLQALYAEFGLVFMQRPDGVIEGRFMQQLFGDDAIVNPLQLDYGGTDWVITYQDKQQIQVKQEHIQNENEKENFDIHDIWQNNNAKGIIYTLERGYYTAPGVAAQYDGYLLVYQQTLYLIDKNKTSNRTANDLAYLYWLGHVQTDTIPDAAYTAAQIDTTETAFHCSTTTIKQQTFPLDNVDEDYARFPTADSKAQSVFIQGAEGDNELYHTIALTTPNLSRGCNRTMNVTIDGEEPSQGDQVFAFAIYSGLSDINYHKTYYKETNIYGAPDDADLAYVVYSPNSERPLYPHGYPLPYSGYYGEDQSKLAADDIIKVDRTPVYQAFYYAQGSRVFYHKLTTFDMLSGKRNDGTQYSGNGPADDAWQWGLGGRRILATTSDATKDASIDTLTAAEKKNILVYQIADRNYWLNDYNRLLMKGAHTVSLTTMMSKEQLQEFDFSKPIFMAAIRMYIIPTKVEYSFAEGVDTLAVSIEGILKR